jgi:hypothetical protein
MLIVVATHWNNWSSPGQNLEPNDTERRFREEAFLTRPFLLKRSAPRAVNGGYRHSRIRNRPVRRPLICAFKPAHRMSAF